MNKALPLVSLLALAAFGCGPSGEKTPGASGSTSSGSSASAKVDPAFAAFLDKLPAELKHDAFEYYGLGNDKPTTLEIVRDGGPPTYGTRTVKPGELKDGKATFILSQAGGLSMEGDITMSLEPDGLYAMSSTMNKLKPHSLEMPAKMEVGGSWKDHTEMDQGGQKIVLDNDLKIVGKERIVTPGGTFDEALHVTSTGAGTFGGKPATLTTESWYVRGVGPVKQIVNLAYKNGPKQAFTTQLADPKKAEAATSPSSSAPPIDLFGGGAGGGQ